MEPDGSEGLEREDLGSGWPYSHRQFQPENVKNFEVS